MATITKGTMTKKQALALFGKRSEQRAKILESDKEVYTDDEINELMDFDPFPRYPAIGKSHEKRRKDNAMIADDDLIDSFDNNYDLWR